MHSCNRWIVYREIVQTISFYSKLKIQIENISFLVLVRIVFEMLETSTRWGKKRTPKWKYMDEMKILSNIVKIRSHAKTFYPHPPSIDGGEIWLGRITYPSIHKKNKMWILRLTHLVCQDKWGGWYFLFKYFHFISSYMEMSDGGSPPFPFPHRLLFRWGNKLTAKKYTISRWRRSSSSFVVAVCFLFFSSRSLNLYQSKYVQMNTELSTSFALFGFYWINISLLFFSSI